MPHSAARPQRSALAAHLSLCPGLQHPPAAAATHAQVNRTTTKVQCGALGVWEGKSALAAGPASPAASNSRLTRAAPACQRTHQARSRRHDLNPRRHDLNSALKVKRSTPRHAAARQERERGKCGHPAPTSHAEHTQRPLWKGAVHTPRRTPFVGACARARQREGELGAKLSSTTAPANDDDDDTNIALPKTGGGGEGQHRAPSTAGVCAHALSRSLPPPGTPHTEQASKQVRPRPRTAAHTAAGAVPSRRCWSGLQTLSKARNRGRPSNEGHACTRCRSVAAAELAPRARWVCATKTTPGGGVCGHTAPAGAPAALALPVSHVC